MDCDGVLQGGGGGGEGEHIPQLLRSDKVMVLAQLAQSGNFTFQVKTLEKCAVANEAKCLSLYPIQMLVVAQSCTHTG